jgi:hypothetical protein
MREPYPDYSTHGVIPPDNSFKPAAVPSRRGTISFDRIKETRNSFDLEFLRFLTTAVKSFIYPIGV